MKGGFATVSVDGEQSRKRAFLSKIYLQHKLLSGLISKEKCKFLFSEQIIELCNEKISA